MNPSETLTIESVVHNVFAHQGFVAVELRGPRSSTPEALQRVDVRPVVVRGETRLQFALQQPRKVTHENLTAEAAPARLLALFVADFKMALLRTTEADWNITLNKRREPQIRRLPPTQTATGEVAHDRRKNHILAENTPLPFLVRLGLMTPEGKLIAARRDKFRQINRFLEIVADCFKEEEKRDRVEEQDRQEATGASLDQPQTPFRVVDFGCGRGYLTFALHHYLTALRGMKVEIIGVDVKADVVADINAIARDIGAEGLSFSLGGITEFHAWERADMVLALHACDTATDAALLQALALQSPIILAAPCCQHELFRQLDNDLMRPLLKHGILRERLTALITDAARAELLTLQGYRVSLVEFVDAEHTPKNLLIRAVRQGRQGGEGKTRRQENKKTGQGEINTVLDPNPAPLTQNQEWERFRDFWHISPALERGLQTGVTADLEGDAACSTREEAATDI